jgi:hypothetical protein
MSSEDGIAASSASTHAGSNCVPGEPFELRERLGRRQRSAVRPSAGHRVERIRHVDDARRKRDGFRPQAEWIPAAVRTLVVQLDDRQVRRQKRHLPQDSRAESGMPFDLLELLRRQRSVLAQI